MTLAVYSGFVSVTVLAIILILRGCWLLFVCKSDPLKAILPSIAMKMFNFGKAKQSHKIMEDNS